MDHKMALLPFYGWGGVGYMKLALTITWMISVFKWQQSNMVVYNKHWISWLHQAETDNQ